MSQKKIIATVNQIASQAKTQGIAHLCTEDTKLKDNYITIDGKKCVNFGSCSYLGLEFNPLIKTAAKDAIDSYGTQFSSSRAYVSPKYYDELEEKLEKIFGAPTIVTPTTTLGHMAAIPTIITKDDAIILDHQVHNSVQTAASLLKSKGTHIELVRHNRMDLLRKKIEEMGNKFENIWYMADGIYSMYGDAAPIDEIYALMDEFPQFRFYVDDAHGMSCYGDYGQGYVLSKKKIHKQMILATSFAKAFATGGGALVFPNREMAQLVRNCGGPLITSGPMQPSALGAACKAADLHLDGTIKKYQEDLEQNIMYTNMMLKKHNLPNLAEAFSPIFFIAASLPKIAYSLINKMKNDGYFLNIGIFPAVPIKNTGVRFTITRLHTFEQIEKMVQAMAKHYSDVLKEENILINDIYKAFKIKPIKIEEPQEKIDSLVRHSKLRVQHHKSIKEVPAEEWNQVLADRGTFDWNCLNLLEKSFKNNASENQNWEFDYLIIRDYNNKIVLATFLTTSIAKDDMLMEKEVSYEIEKERLINPHYMTSKITSLGSPLTEGNHLYIDSNSTLKKEALDILFQKIDFIQEQNNATQTIIRDLPIYDTKTDNLMGENGFFKVEMPINHKIGNANWTNEEEFYSQLSKNGKRHYRKNITKTKDNFNVVIKNEYNESEIESFYDLYSSVKSNNLEINTFKLPKKLFQNIANDKDWEILSLYLVSEIDLREDKKPVAMAICHKGQKNYSFVLAGLDYNYNVEFSCYRQLLAQIVLRARTLNYQNINMGYTSDVEKQRFGTKAIKSCSYMQVKDNYSMEALGAMSINKKQDDEVNKRRILPV